MLHPLPLWHKGLTLLQFKGLWHQVELSSMGTLLLSSPDAHFLHFTLWLTISILCELFFSNSASNMTPNWTWHVEKKFLYDAQCSTDLYLQNPNFHLCYCTSSYESILKKCIDDISKLIPVPNWMSKSTWYINVYMTPNA